LRQILVLAQGWGYTSDNKAKNRVLGRRMSEPLTSVEIEDVLSSIRRLVSDDMRPAPRPDPVAVQPVGEKLILTPALRVVTEQAEAPMAENVGIEQVVASLGAAVVSDDQWEHDTSDVLPERALPQDWSLPEDAVPAAADAAMTAVPGWAQEGDGQEDSREAEPALTDTPEPDPAWAAAAEARVIAELEGREDLLSDAAQTGPAGGIFAADDPLSYDEQVLRDMVREIIREELQGGLGERITRNIRKLVRAEMARALATQTMD
jgi:cell pole-organizing protein PopZ